MHELHESYLSSYSSESNRRKTVGITLPRNLVEKARKHKLNISRISEQALISIIDYLEGYVDEQSESQSRIWSRGWELNPFIAALQAAA